MHIEGVNCQSCWGVGTGNYLKTKPEVILVCTIKKNEAYNIETGTGKIAYLSILPFVLRFVHNKKNPNNYRDIVGSTVIQSPFLLKTHRIKNYGKNDPVSIRTRGRKTGGQP